MLLAIRRHRLRKGLNLALKLHLILRQQLLRGRALGRLGLKLQPLGRLLADLPIRRRQLQVELLQGQGALLVGLPAGVEPLLQRIQLPRLLAATTQHQGKNQAKARKKWTSH